MKFSEITKLRERAGELATEARAELDKITDKSTDGEIKEIEGRFDQMMADHDKIMSRLEREHRLANVGGSSEAPERPEGEARGDEPVSEPEYREVFSKLLRYGVASLADEERSVLLKNRQELPEEMRAQSIGTDSAGGYTVPDEFSGQIEKSLKMWGPMWDGGIVRELNTSNGRRIDWPTVDDTANTGRIKAENAAVDDDNSDDVAFGEKQLDAYVYDTGMVRVPIELLQDSAFDLNTLMSDLFGERLGRLANSVLTTGTGSSQPNGVVTASAAGKTAASATAITADELIDLLHSVDPAYRMSPRSRWMFNDSTMAAIRKLKDGDGNYLWQLGDIRNGEPATILGHAYAVNQAVASIGAAAKPVIFGDFSKYVVRKVNGFQMITLRERYAEMFQVGLVGFKRFDGELLNTAAVKHLVNAGS
ncbi:phage major capsid protein [Haliea salexigens]|uniref:phage major capsid protein n=1 Tax=Haliea salexigens TaxID=287487 RepID=UPI0003F4CE98|nr:phage major capsid protein [Haliea salexigens]